MLSGSPGGQMTGKFGRVAAHVSHSLSRDKAKALTMTGIYGQTFFDSLEAVAHKSSWVSRLQARLGIVGSTESDLIWKAKITPAKALIYRLAPQTRRISDKDYSGSLWTTPRVSDKNTESRDAAMKELTRSTNGGKKKLALDVHYATWPTLTTEISGTTQFGLMEPMVKRGALNPAFVCWLMGFPQEWESCAPMVTPSSRKSRQR